MATNSSVSRIEIFARQCDFTIWLRKFELILKIGKIQDDEKIDFLLTNLDLPIFESILTTFINPTYTEAVSFLEARYSTQDKFLDRLEFFNISYSGTFDEYAAKLQTLYENFNSTTIREEILISKFLATIPRHLSTELRIRRPETLSECVQICNSLQMNKLPLSAAAINSDSKPLPQKHTYSSTRKCFRCGSNSHLASDSKCPAKSAQCNFCRKMGHFASVCTSKQNSNTYRSNQGNKNQNSNLKVNTTSFVSEYTNPEVSKSYIDVIIGSKSGQRFQQSFLVDTGSDVCTLPFNIYKRYFNEPLRPCNDITLRNFDQSEIPITGILPNVCCEFSGRSAQLDFIICDKNAVIGANAISKLELTVTGQQNNLVTYSIDRARKSDKSQTETLPKLNGFTFFIKLKSDAPSTLIQKNRRVPFSLEAAIESEISKLLQDDIIEEIDSSPYLSPIVVVPKPDGKIRLCVDYKKINQHIVVDQHPLPTAEEIFARLTGAKVFSKLDLKSAYHQLEIKEESRDLTAFTSHVGQFRYKRLPFGLANGPSAYMKVISTILKDCPNTACYLDDILIFGSSTESHDASLRLTLQRLKDYGITLNDSKCLYKQTAIPFLGRFLSADGVSPLPDTRDAILNAPVPHDKSSLRSFLGLVNFYRNFIPNATQISASLCDLLKDNVPFHWTDVHQSEFRMLKQRLSDAVPLAFYDSDVNTTTFLTTDASGYGISAVLTQVSKETKEERPVYFLSRKLSENEKSYSASEKEFLAVLWSAERLHQYLYGRPFIVRTDHQSLKQLLMNGFQGGSAPCRVIRWATKLMQYNFSVQYIPGKENYIADALSRVPQQTSDSHMELFSISLENEVSEVVPVTLHDIKSETACDETLQLLIQTATHGWPRKFSAVPEPVKPYWNVRNEISVIDGIVFKSEKFVIPTLLRDKLVTFAHDGHMGMSKCKTRLRQFYWWPNLNESVESRVRSCSCCREPHRESPVQVPHYTAKPWHQIAIDIKGPVYDTANRPCYIMVVVDCFTKYTYIRAYSSITSRKVIEFLNGIFALLGQCTILTSDNGPQFISHEFCEYLRKRGIVHRRSSLFNPQSNGVVERMNKNINKLIEAKNFSNIGALQELLDNYAINYHSTQHSTTGKSPAEMMLSFPLRTNLNVLQEAREDVQVLERMEKRSEENAVYANERRRPTDKNKFSVGDQIVTIKNQVRTIVAKVGPYTFRLDNGFTINVRNILRKLPPSLEYVSLPSVSPVSSDSTNTADNSSSGHGSGLAATVTRPSSSNLDLETSVRRSERHRRRPRRFQDFLT